MSRAVLVGGEVLVNAHDMALCAGRPCCVHAPSDHHMMLWDQHYRLDRQMMERICPHGVGHPDPDDISFDTVHGCDGCCNPPLTDEELEGERLVDEFVAEHALQVGFDPDTGWLGVGFGDVRAAELAEVAELRQCASCRTEIRYREGAGWRHELGFKATGGCVSPSPTSWIDRL